MFEMLIGDTPNLFSKQSTRRDVHLPLYGKALLDADNVELEILKVDEIDNRPTMIIL